MSLSSKLVKYVVRVVIVVIIVFIAGLILGDVENIEGFETGVVYKWKGGILDDPLDPGLRWVLFGKINKLDIGKNKLTFADENGIKTLNSRMDIPENDFVPIEVKCGKDGGQLTLIHISVLYSVKKDSAVSLWKEGVGRTYRYVILKRAVINAVNGTARIREALDIYSGTGFNELQNDIEKDLIADENLAYFNILQVTIYQIRLDEDYEAEIEEKQLAKQEKLRAAEEALAAKEEAKKTKAEAQVMIEEETADADASKIEVVLAAEARNEKRILEAEAIKQEKALAGVGEKMKKLAEAEGVRALGLAEAEVEDAKKIAKYDGESGKHRAAVDVAQILQEKLNGLFNNTKIVPEDALVAISDGPARIPLAITNDSIGGKQAANAKNRR